MSEIGKYNNLKVVKILDFGAYLDGENNGEILLPILQLPPNLSVDDFIEVFLYTDSEDRIIATSREPYAIAGDFAYLEVVDVNKFGAFLDWGLDKNLIVPFREQRMKMQINRRYLVYVFLDERSQRMVASAKLDKFIDKEPTDEYVEYQEVEIIIQNKTDLGYNAIINNKHAGLIYENEIFTNIRTGQKRTAYIKKVREDGKIDLTLNNNLTETVASEIFNRMKKNDNFIALTDKSEPDEIYNQFGVSKKNFKKAIGFLYKKRLIEIKDNGIFLKAKLNNL